MEELKAGEFVRTKTEGICRFSENVGDADGKFCGVVDKPFWLRENNIENHSFNILDLVEAGDYVNGVLVEECSDIDDFENGTHKLCIFDTYYESYVPIKNIKIETVVTKAQFAKLEYEVK